MRSNVYSIPALPYPDISGYSLCDAFNDYRGIGDGGDAPSTSGSSPSSSTTAPLEPEEDKIEESKPSSNQNSPPVSDSNAGDVYEAVELINAERVKAGMSELAVDSDLMAMAQTRAEECASVDSLYVNGQAHTRLDGSDWKTVFGEYGWDIPKYRGENCGYGTNRAAAAAQVNSWMKSSGHKDNILEDGITKIGVGYSVTNGKHYWVMITGS